MGAQRRFFRARPPSAPKAPDPPSRTGSPARKGLVKPILLTVGLSAVAVVLMDGPLAEDIFKSKSPAGDASRTVVQKALAADQSRQDRPAQVLAEYIPATISSSNVLMRVNAGAIASEPVIAPSGERPKSAAVVRSERSPASALSFGAGDKLKIAFYERLNVEEDKWGRPTSALRSIQQRPELSGEYTVQEDGTISIPLLGSISVANRSAQQVHTALDEAFEHLLGRKGMVNVVLLERAPIYVLGPVKNPGSFKYMTGSTVLHAIAMAGGLDRGASDPWSKVEAVREYQKRSGAVDTVVKLMARDAVLKAERDGNTPKIPLRLMELVGATEAIHLINEQGERRKAIVQARKDRERAMANSFEAAKQDLQMYGHTTALDKLVKTRQERVDSTRALVERNVVAKSMLSQVEGELSDAEQRRQDAINQYGMAKQRLASLAADKLKVQADLEKDLAIEIDAVERQITESEREMNTSEGILKNLPVTRTAYAPSKETSGITYQIVRRTASGPVNIAADGMTLLQPGDLVNIAIGSGESAALPPMSSVPTVPVVAPDEGSSAGRTASHQKIGRTIAQD
jgi:protein involved in polysaccharide export with SLBB domain